MGEKLCTVCGETKPFSAFAKSAAAKTGLFWRCRSCTAEYYHANKDRIKNAVSKWAARVHSEDPAGNSIKRLVWGAKTRSKKNGLPFNITVADLPAPLTCSVLGVVLDYSAKGRGGHNRNSPSIDRLVPALGYTRGNVRIISFRANSLRNDGTADELEKVAADARCVAFLTS